MTNILPPRLDALLAALNPMSREQVVIRGWSRECEQDQHVWARWVSGTYRARGVPLTLVLLMCTNCESVEVRDRTLDVFATAARGRRDALLGWYSGARRNQRVYM